MKLSSTGFRLTVCIAALFVVGGAAVWWLDQEQRKQPAPVEYWSGYRNSKYSEAENEEIRTLENDLREIVIPSIEFKEVPFSEAIAFLQEEAMSAKLGIDPIHFDIDPSISRSNPINLHLTDVPMSEGLRYTISLNMGSLRVLPGRRIFVGSFEVVNTLENETQEGNFYLHRSVFPTYTGAGPHDFRKELESLGVDIRDQDKALFYPDQDLVWASLPRSQMEMVELYFSGICYHPQPTLFESTRDRLYRLVGYDPYALPVTPPPSATSTPVTPKPDPFGGGGPLSEPDPFGGSAVQ